jgi:hypothetical protein
MEDNERRADYVDISIDITSEILFYDDHTEAGPYTSFNATVKGSRAFWQFGDLYNRTIAKLTRKPFGGWFMWELGQVYTASNPESTKKWITYYVSAHADIFFPDGTSETFDRQEEYRVPLYNSLIDWNLKIE